MAAHRYVESGDKTGNVLLTITPTHGQPFMKAMVYHRYGSGEVLSLEEVAKPTPKDDEILIRIKACSVNDWDWSLLRGEFINRLLNGWFKPKKIRILGSDVAGEVEAVGGNVSEFKMGDRVYGDLCMLGFGGFADYVCAPATALAKIPTTMSFEQAAAIPQAGMLAVQALHDLGDLPLGQSVLINGAGGGVGTLGIAIAKRSGATVTGVDSGLKLDLLRNIGYDQVIDYKREDFTRGDRHYDLIVDAKTTRPPWHYFRALTPGGTYVTVGGKVPRLLQLAALAPLLHRFTRKRLRVVSLKPNKDLAYFNELFESGELKPVIDGPYPLAQLPEVMDRFGRGLQMGKMIITL